MGGCSYGEIVIFHQASKLWRQEDFSKGFLQNQWSHFADKLYVVDEACIALNRHIQKLGCRNPVSSLYRLGVLDNRDLTRKNHTQTELLDERPLPG